MRYAVVLIINIILVLAGFFLVILDYPLRHNKIYKEIRILVYIIFLALLYWLFPT